MWKVKLFFLNLWHRDEGASALEYALLAAMVAVVISLFVKPVGDQVKVVMNKVLTALGGSAI